MFVCVYVCVYILFILFLIGPPPCVVEMLFNVWNVLMLEIF